MLQRTQHMLLWGVLRYALGIAQMTFALASLILLATAGLKPRTFIFAGITTCLTLISRILYRGQRDPRLKNN
jgi:Kef-type K+ transport system membrane component KefB